MIYDLLNWEVLEKILLNTLFISIPEELFLVMFTLISVGEFEYWKEPECKKLINKFDYIRIFFPTISVALLTNILRYTGLNYGVYQFLSPILFYIIIIFTNDIFGDASALKWIGKAFLFFIIGFLFIGISEFVYMPFVLYGTGLTMSEINGSFLLYFAFSLPARLLQYSLLLYLINKKRTLLKRKFMKYLLSKPILLVNFSVLIVFNALFLQVMVKFIVFDQVLLTISQILQVFIIVGVILFPMLNISAYLWSTYYIKTKELNDKKINAEKLLILLKNMKSYTNLENHDNINWKFNEIGMAIEEVAKGLYSDNSMDKLK